MCPHRSNSKNPRVPSGERVLVALVLVMSFVSVALFATVTPKGRAPDEYRYYADIARLAHTGDLRTTTGHPPLYSVVGLLPYSLGRNDGERQYLLRLLGVLFMVVTVYVTYRTSSELFGEGTLARWVPPLVVALLPQFSFISGSINSDALLAMLAAIFLWGCVRVIRGPATPKMIVVLISVAVLGMLAKQRFLVLLPLLAPVLAIAAYRFSRDRGFGLRRRALGVLAVAFGLVTLGVLTFVYRAAPVAFGNTAGLFPAAPGVNSITRDFVVDMFTMFWGYFDWLALPMHVPVYLAYLALLLVAGSGVAIAVVRRLARLGRVTAFADWRAAVWLLFTGAIVLSVASVVQYHLGGLGAQGRYLFVAVLPFALFVGRGLAEVVPRRFARYAFQGLTLLLVGVVFFEVVFTLIPYYY